MDPLPLLWLLRLLLLFAAAAEEAVKAVANP